MTSSAAENVVSVPLDVAALVVGAFLPLNPNKLRSATPEVKAAAIAFKAAVLRAERARGYRPGVKR